MGNDRDLENDRADYEPTLGSFDGLVDQEKSWMQRAAWVQEGEVDVLDAGLADGTRLPGPHRCVTIRRP